MQAWQGTERSHWGVERALGPQSHDSRVAESTHLDFSLATFQTRLLGPDLGFRVCRWHFQGGSGGLEGKEGGKKSR